MHRKAWLVFVFGIGLMGVRAQDTLPDYSSDTLKNKNKTTTKVYLLANDTIWVDITVTDENNSRVIFINLHDDENTAVEAIENLLHEKGGVFMHLHNQGTRNLHFIMNGKGYKIDPNRMYTPAGIKANLLSFKNYSVLAAKKVAAFADTLLKNYIAGKKMVIALHNNSIGGLSIKSYTKGKPEAKNAAKVYSNPQMSEEDFVLTTQQYVYEHCKKQHINVVLQHISPKDDGSLSVYAAKHRIAYINVEAQHGHFDEQLHILQVLWPVIEPVKHQPGER